MNKKLINAPEWANYLREFMTELPVNCLFNKGTTGCGGTELALRNDKHTIIAMPFISLVKNKAENKKHQGKVLPVDGLTSIHEIEEYIKTHKVWKIAVVYNSLPKVINALQGMGLNPFEECFLLVDEYHVLFTQYVFRDDAVRRLLNLASEFKEKTYMSATPLHEELILKELRDLPVCDVVWPNKKEVTVLAQPVSSPLKYTIEVINNKLDDKIFGNLHFFVNSANFISGVLKRVNANPDDVRVVCADNERNKSKISGYKIGKPSDSPCKINFYTSTCFEGCDIFDRNGKSFIISEGKNPNTLYDISTLFIQIIGRLRDSDYNDKVIHVVSNNQYKGDVSYGKYKEMMESDYKMTQPLIDNYNSWDKDSRKAWFSRYGKEHFINRFIYVDDMFNYSLDENLLNKSLLDYRLKTEVYNKSYYLIKAYKESGLNVRCANWISYSDKLKNNPSSRTKVKDLIEEYHLLSTTQKWGNNTERKNVISAKCDFIEEAYYQLGIEKIRDLNYNTTLIKRELIKISDRPQVKKIIELVVKKIGYQNPVDNIMAKQALKEVYEILSIKKTATASKLNDYFITNEVHAQKDGKTSMLIELVREKTILED